MLVLVLCETRDGHGEGGEGREGRAKVATVEPLAALAELEEDLRVVIFVDELQVVERRQAGASVEVQHERLGLVAELGRLGD